MESHCLHFLRSDQHPSRSVTAQFRWIRDGLIGVTVYDHKCFEISRRHRAPVVKAQRSYVLSWSSQRNYFFPQPRQNISGYLAFNTRNSCHSVSQSFLFPRCYWCTGFARYEVIQVRMRSLKSNAPRDYNDQSQRGRECSTLMSSYQSL